MPRTRTFSGSRLGEQRCAISAVASKACYQRVLGINTFHTESMTGHLDLLWKASLDSALQNETIWICSRIFSSERQHNGHQQKDHKASGSIAYYLDKYSCIMEDAEPWFLWVEPAAHFTSPTALQWWRWPFGSKLVRKCNFIIMISTVHL